LNPSKFDKEYWFSVKNTDWIQVLETENISDLETVRENIIDILDKTELWLEWLKIFDKILADYWVQEKETTLNGLKVQAYYNFIREQCLKKVSDIPEFAKEDCLTRLNRKNESRQPQPSRKAVCPKCGSSNTTKGSTTQIFCKDCGKYTHLNKVKQYAETQN
jgi:hypothetical protein